MVAAFPVVGEGVAVVVEVSRKELLMKFTPFFLFAVACFGQSTVLVEYVTTEPDYEANIRYAIGCLPGTPDCGVPRRDVSHFEPFDTVEAALKWVNCWQGCASETAATSGVTGTLAACKDCATSLTVWGQPLRASYPKRFIRLLAIKEIPVAETVTIKELPQPPVRETKSTIALKKQ